MKNNVARQFAIYPKLVEGSKSFIKVGKQFIIKSDFFCASENLIYVVKCSDGYHYIGSRDYRSDVDTICTDNKLHSQNTKLYTLVNTLTDMQFSIFPLYYSASGTSS